MSRIGIQDLGAILRGLQSVVNASIKLQEAQCKQVWNNSSLKGMAEEMKNTTGKGGLGRTAGPNMQGDVMKQISEIIQRASMVVEGVKGYVRYSGTTPSSSEPFATEAEINELNLYGGDLQADTSPSQQSTTTTTTTSSPTAPSPPVSQMKDAASVKFSSLEVNEIPITKPLFENPASGDAIPEQHSAKGVPITQTATEYYDIPISKSVAQNVTPNFSSAPVRNRQELSVSSRERKVPSSRLGRMMSFGGLAAGLGAGALAELTRRSLGMRPEAPGVSDSLDSALLTPANAQRIVNTLCKVRGAALKIGQILSIQDSSVISPGLQKAFERVRQSADFMPGWQVERVLSQELGPDWRSKMKDFELKPFAAASIGQVHLAVLHDGREAAMKIQYPGVAQGIQSDIDNLIGILKVWNIFPEGFFIDNLVEVAKRELSWEVDYVREAECTKKFAELLKPYPDYIVPQVIDELSAKQVFTTALIDGIPVDKCADLDQDTRLHICRLTMQLCLKELFEFRYMQTDPNWSNFFYDPHTRKLALLDFGASREYSKEFMDTYIQVIRGAADDDRDKVLELSRELGFLTGYESKVMEEAHVDAVMILGEVFRSEAPFDFGTQSTTKKIQHLVPTMIKHRLCPPPEEIYSLHRKLSGVFLLCSKLRVSMLCRPMFEDAYQKYMSQ